MTGRVVITPGAELPYKVVLEQEGDGTIELPVATVRDGENLIRRRLAVPAKPMSDLAQSWQTGDPEMKRVFVG
jgi:hypothetical protein